MVKLVYFFIIATLSFSSGFAKEHKSKQKSKNKPPVTQKAPTIEKAELKVLLQEQSIEPFLSWIKTVESDFEQKHVFFFDTFDRELQKQGVILRVRRMHDETYDSSVKLRSDVFTELPNTNSKKGKLDCELDIVYGGPRQTACTLTQKSKKVLPSVDSSSAGSYFNSAQTAFAKFKLPDIKWKDLKFLGSIIASEWDTQQDGLQISCELWTLPSKKRILECSTRVDIKNVDEYQSKLVSFFKSKNFLVSESSQFKTDIVFSELK